MSCVSFHVLFFFFFFFFLQNSVSSLCLFILSWWHSALCSFLLEYYSLKTFENRYLVAQLPFWIVSPLSNNFQVVFVENSTGKQHVFEANSAYSCTQRFSESCVLGLHIGLDCARSNTPKLGCFHCFFFFSLCNSALMNSDLQCSMCCMCTESFTFAYVWKWKSLRCVQLLANRLSRPEYWSGQPCVSPGDLPNPGIKSRSLALQADSLPAEPPGKPCCCC